MFVVNVYVDNVLIEFMEFNNETFAQKWADKMQDSGYKVRMLSK